MKVEELSKELREKIEKHNSTYAQHTDPLMILQCLDEDIIALKLLRQDLDKEIENFLKGPK